MAVHLVVATSGRSAACSAAASATTGRTTAPAAAEFSAVPVRRGILVVGRDGRGLFVLLADDRAPLLRAACTESAQGRSERRRDVPSMIQVVA